MKTNVSPEAMGTLAALRELRKIKSFSPECADELLSQGLVSLEGDHLIITNKGVQKVALLYSN